MDSDVPIVDLELIQAFTDITRDFSNESIGPGGLNSNTDYACWNVQHNIFHHQFFLFSSLLLIIVGIAGNCLSIVIFSSAKMRSVSTHCYLTALAISDSAYLLTVFFTHTLTTMRCLYFPHSKMDIFHRSSTLCVGMQLLLDVFSDWSPCIILAVTVERYLACCHPRRFNHLCSNLHAKIICTTMFFICAITSAPYHIKYMANDHNICSIDVNHELEFTIWYSIEAVAFRITPVIIVAILNVFIIMKITSSPAGYALPGARQHRLTVMLLMVSSSYIILYLPVLVIFAIWKFQRSNLIDINQNAVHATQPYADTFYILAFAINFFLYVISRKSFRYALSQLLCRCIKGSGVSGASRDITSTDATQL